METQFVDLNEKEKGWTFDEKTYYDFITNLIDTDTLPEDINFFFVNLADLANEYYDERKRHFKNTLKNSQTKKEFLEFSIKSYKITYDQLLNKDSEPKENDSKKSLKERRIQAGYFYALISGGDFSIYDVIMGQDGQELEALILDPQNVYTYKEGEKLPISLDTLTVFFKNFYEYSEAFKEVAEGYFLCLIVSYAEKLLENLTGTPNNEVKGITKNNIDTTRKIMVNCTPAQFATIIEILMNKDYLQKTNNAEGTAKLLLRTFEFKNNNPSVESLGKNLFKGKVTINADDFEDLNKIPHRKYLKGTKNN